MIHIREVLREDHDSMIEIAKALYPQWFNELGLEQIARDIQTEQGLVALDEERVVGFVIYCTDKNCKTAELSWIAVRPELHRKGTGRALVNALEEILTREGFRALEVSTVAATIEYEPYARTREFYYGVGFSDVQIDKGWFRSGDDRLLLRKQLSSTAQ
jgi:ribosomal protein S18 acetylase RimI-like enzyme